MSDQAYAAVDIGGTKLLAVIADGDGRVLGESRQPTKTLAEPASVLRQAVEAIDGALAEATLRRSDLRAVGLAIAGPTDFARGVVSESPNLRAWHNVPAASLVSEAMGLPAFLENDANAAALGELSYGACQDVLTFVYLTVSTGIGGGIVIDGRLYRGASGAAGEFGHMVMLPDGPHCGCGNRGCLETLASGTAIEREAEVEMRLGRAPKLRQLFAGKDELTAELVAEAARAGDRDAMAVIDRAARFFGVGLAAIVNALNPEAIVVGGGVSKMGAIFLDPAEAAMREHAFELPASAVSLRLSQLGDRAGVLGAIALAREQVEGA